MSLWLSFLRRDFRRFLRNPRISLFPFLYLLMSFFLLHFFSSGPPLPKPELFWVLLILSTIGTGGQTVFRDKELGILKSLQAQSLLSWKYLSAKGISLTILWTFTFWSAWLLLGFVEGNLKSWLPTLGAVACFCSSLAFSHIFLDALLCHTFSSTMIGLFLILPFMIPSLTIILLFLNELEYSLLLLLMSYNLFLSLLTGILAYLSLRS